jgi:hypothetical protein
MPQIENGRVIATPDEACAGVSGHRLRNVLMFRARGVSVLFTIVDT